MLFWMAVVYVSVYKLWMTSVLPFSVPMLSPHDGTWFFKQAMSISLGDWFGKNYDAFTLIKLPMYSMFLSGISSIGLNPKLAIDLLYVVASLVFLLALRSALPNRLAAFLGFVVVLANPVTFSDYWATTLRLNLFMPLVLMYISALLALIANLSRAHPRLPLIWVMICAISLSIAWYTREEAVWMLAGLAPMMLLTVTCFMKQKQRIRLVFFWLSIGLIPYLTGQYLASINQDRYGFDGVVDTNTPQIKRALGAIFSLNTANDDSYNYLTLETRDKLRQISNDTRRLIEPLLDDETGKYTFFGDNIGGSFASWSIRFSMAHNNYYRNPDVAESAYGAIADDIESYCRETAGGCRKVYIPGVLVKPVSWKRIYRLISNSAYNLFYFNAFPPAEQMKSPPAGDAAFQYTVNRFFNANTTWIERYDLQIRIKDIERKRNSKLRTLVQHFQSDFYVILLLACAGVLVAVFSRKAAPKLIGLLMLGSFAGSLSVYFLVVLFAMPGFDRLLANSSIPLLAFSGYFLAYFLQQGMSWLGESFKHRLGFRGAL